MLAFRVGAHRNAGRRILRHLGKSLNGEVEDEVAKLCLSNMLTIFTPTTHIIFS